MKTQSVQGAAAQFHFDIQTFRQHGMKIANSDTVCKFSKHPKCDVLMAPNHFNAEWLYSVPCGEEHCTSWIFLDVPAKKQERASDKNIWITSYLKKLGWDIVVNLANTRFSCATSMQ